MSTEWIPVSDPPKKPGWYLVDNPKWSCEYIAKWNGREWLDESSDGYFRPTHWRELPPRAPKPDPFEEWWEGLTTCAGSPHERYIGGSPVLKTVAIFIWDAAMKAKEGK